MDLFNQFDDNTTILTPNRRLSAALIKQHQALQMQQNKSSWITADILPFPSWLQRLWQIYTAKQFDATPLLLTNAQEGILWEEILQNSPLSENLLHKTAAADLAKSAWGLLKQWQINISHPALTLTEDGHVFQQWATEFATRCLDNHWLDTQSLADKIKENLQKKTIASPKKIICVGFTEFSPQQRALLNTCEELGSQIIIHENTQKAATINQVSLTDEGTEIRTMARWAKKIYDDTTEKKAYLIACVIPRLESNRDLVLNIFSDVFSENNTFTLDHTLLPFNISAGKSLASFPIIHTALQLLQLQSSDIPIAVMSSLLRSPFLGRAETERLRRANFDMRLKNNNSNTVALKKLLSEGDSQNFQSSCPALAKQLAEYFTLLAQIKKTTTIHEWVEIFIELLTLLGWPGERSLNSQEYQVVQRWLELLSEFQTFATILPEQNYTTTLHQLSQLATKTIFQPQTPEAPIQILGMLEAAELPFEHLWVMGLDDANWPPAPKPNPLIPQKLQKSLHMPHATAERELAFCQRLMQQFIESAQHVVFSHAEKNADIDLRPSSLLNTISRVNIDDIPLSSFTSPAENIFNSQQLEKFSDETAPAISTEETIRGGSSIFKQQAACPFKAFAEHRLHARALESPTLGLRHLDRGIIVHKALEIVWQKIKSSEQLNNLNLDEQQTIVHHAAEEALKLASKDNYTSESRYLGLELQRLKNIVMKWLELENTRPAFKVISQELEHKTTISGLEITLRIDRVDELENGHCIMIDYKTGKNNHIKDWFGERLDEPQLPLYIISSIQRANSIAFAQIHPTHMEIKGISEQDTGMKSIKMLAEVTYAKTKSWKTQLEEWRTYLEKLGNDFTHGIAIVDPKDINKTCRDCQLHAFCRIHEKML